jgi:hypothetical protein
MPNFHEPKIVERATPIYRSILLECERRRIELNWPMWKVDEISGVQDNFYSKMLHADRPSGRQSRWETLNLVVRALWSQGFDLQISHKPGGNLSAEDLRLKIWFASSDHDRVSRRKLMSHLGKKGAAARMKKLGKRERKTIARRASIAAAIKRSERARARAQTPSGAAT